MWTKVCIGITQILVMTELTIRIEQSMRMQEVHDVARSERKNRTANCLIYLCRAIATGIIVSILSVSIYKDRTVQPEPGSQETLIGARNAYISSLHDLTAYTFLALTCLLASSISLLVWRLYRKF